jgi:GAF domain-containing protein
MHRDLTFYESGLQLIKGNGDLRLAVGELIQLAAEDGNSGAGSLYIADWHQQVLKPLVTYGLPKAYVEACGDVRVGDQCCGRAVQHRKPWIVSDMLTDPLFATAREATSSSPIRAAFSVPVIDKEGECFGSLACHYAETHTASVDEINSNKVWATMIAHAMSRYKADGLLEPALGTGITAVQRQTDTLQRAS